MKVSDALSEIEALDVLHRAAPTYLLVGQCAELGPNVEAGRVNLTLGQLTRIAAAMAADIQVSLPLVTIEPARVAEPAAAR